VKSLHWLLPHPKIAPQDLKRSVLASARLRAGTLVDLCSQRHWGFTAGEPARNSSVLVVGKIGGNEFGRYQRWLADIGQAKKNGAVIILDYTDDHLSFGSPMTAFYKEVLAFTDCAVTSSERLMTSLQRHWQGPIALIADALEVPIVPPKSTVHASRSFVWFGHPSNVEFLVQFLKAKIVLFRTSRITVITDAVGIGFVKSAQLAIDASRVRFIAWTSDAIVRHANDCDICIIPSNVGSPRKSGVSSNRLLTALSLGLPTAAERLSSYEEFKDYFADIRTIEFDDLVRDPLRLTEMIRIAQREIVPLFAKDKIAERWFSLVESVVTARSMASAG
jgi:hypothetical protein